MTDTPIILDRSGAAMTSMREALVLCFGALGASPVLALDETFEVPTRTISDEDFLRGDDAAGTPVTITGRLQGPDSTGPVPVVILLHGSGGPASGAIGAWRYYLNGLGITTLRLDSYTARGLEEVSSDPAASGYFTQLYDAYRAADALAADPRIDGSRIAFLGSSRGGIASLYSAMTRFQEAFGPEDAKIVARLAFYPLCNFGLVGELDVTGEPIREFHGAEDDWAPAAPCQDYFERLQAAGADAVMTVYPGALHQFDNVSNPALVTYPDDLTSRNCMRREENFQLINIETGQPFSFQDDCIEHGPSTQYNDAAATAAQEAVRSLLEEVFGRSAAP
jgi:dienelactone hydrolase